MTIEPKTSIPAEYHKAQMGLYRSFHDDTSDVEDAPVKLHPRAKPKPFHVYRVTFQLVGPGTLNQSTYILQTNVEANSMEAAVTTTKSMAMYQRHDEPPTKYWLLRHVKVVR